MKKIATISLILITSFCYSQTKDFFKIWIGTTEYKIGNFSLGNLDLGEEYESDYMLISDSIKLDSIEIMNLRFKDSVRIAHFKDSIKIVRQKIKNVPVKIDTFYSSIETLLDIKKNGKAIYKRLGFDEEIISWSRITQKEIKLNFEKPLVARLDSLNHLSLILNDGGSNQRKYLFEPISKSLITLSMNKIGTILSNHFWEVTLVKHKSKDYSRHFMFEKDSLFISTYKNDTATFINRNNWKIDKYKNHYFIYIGNDYFPFYMHLTEFNNSKDLTFKVDRYFINGFPFENVYPSLQTFNIIGHKLLTENRYKRMKSRLIGFWASEDDPFPIYKNLFIYKQRNTFLTYNFGRDGFVIINFGGEVTDEYGVRTINKSLKYKWRLSRTGGVLIFKDGQNSELIGAITFLDKNTIEIRKDMLSLSGNYVGNMTFKLIKKR